VQKSAVLCSAVKWLMLLDINLHGDSEDGLVRKEMTSLLA
jgi:hypothetical protein